MQLLECKGNRGGGVGFTSEPCDLLLHNLRILPNKCDVEYLCPKTIAAGQSASLTLTFTPRASGTASGLRLGAAPPQPESHR